MNFLSICSGIEAASVAWEAIWTPIGFSEIDEFPSAVLAHHYPDVPNYGDMTNYMEWQIHEPIDVICGGTPCQAFSVAGQRKSLEDDRGNLSLTFCKIADHFDPEIVIWENVPGVLSTKDNAFGCFLAELAGLSEPILPPPRKSKHNDFGVVNGTKRLVAWRVLDAQYFGLAQRRRRVFVVAFRGSGNWRSAAALFPIAESVSGNPKPSRAKGQKNTSSVKGGVGAGGVAKTLIAGGYKLDPNLETYVIHGSQDPIVSNDVSHAMGRNNGLENVIAFTTTDADLSPALTRGFGDRGVDHNQIVDDGAVIQGGRPRRLMPIECERLQGFPEVTKRCVLTFYNNTIFDICFIDQLNINALADQSYHKSPNSVLIAEEKESMLLARYAGQPSNANQVELKKPALVSVRIDLERQLLLIHNQEKPLLSVKVADKKKWCPLPIQVADFVRLSVATLTALERKAPTGSGESQANTKSFTHQKSGKKFASQCGLEIGGHVKDVQKFTKKVTECMKYITSEAGQSSLNSEQIHQTLLYCVTTAINSFIQEKTHLKNSYVLSIEITSGYTAIPWRGKPATECPDSHRYKALGNSWATNVARWIGQRINYVITQ